MRLGAFDEVVEPNEVVPRALELARGLAAFPPEVYASTKSGLRDMTVGRLQASASEDPLLDRWVR